MRPAPGYGWEEPEGPDAAEACSSLSFDGQDDYLSLGSTVDYGNTYTIEFWMNPSDVSGWDMVVGHNLNNTGSFAIEACSGCEGCGQPSGSDGYAIKWDHSERIDSSQCVPSTGWHHVAGVADNGTARLYLNGALVGSSTTETLGAIGPPVLS